MRASDLTGKRYANFCVVGISHRHNNCIFWKCLCACGQEFIERSANINNGRRVSCGCKKNAIRHGYTYKRLHQTWRDMKQRCYNKNNLAYKNYGGRGIAVCRNWLFSFEAFRDWALLSGYTDALTIERLDVNGEYSPTNCTWIPIQDQWKNKRRHGGNYGTGKGLQAGQA